MNLMYIEIEKEMSALIARRDRSMPLTQDERDFKDLFNDYRYASFHKPHGCAVLPCAVCRGARIPYDKQER